MAERKLAEAYGYGWWMPDGGHKSLRVVVQDAHTGEPGHIWRENQAPAECFAPEPPAPPPLAVDDVVKVTHPERKDSYGIVMEVREVEAAVVVGDRSGYLWFERRYLRLVGHLDRPAGA